MARRVALGTGAVSASVADLLRGASETGAAAERATDASADLSGYADALGRAAQGFVAFLGTAA